MSTRNSTSVKFKRMFVNILSIAVILAMAFPVTGAAYAASDSHFVGHWEAVDLDGSDIRMTIGGPTSGPFRISWTESYISFCDGEAGIVRGMGWLNEEDPNLLEADLHVECFTTGASLDFHLVWRYHPATNTLSSRYDNGMVTIWHRPGKLPAPPPALGLRVNYGHDWVESFYEAGHMAWITVTESDGVTVKATTQLITEPKDYWGGETGFQTLTEGWVPVQPDIQPYDWVYGWVDNGASAQAQIGEIAGMIDLDADSIEGTILAPWFPEQEVDTECLPWGAPRPLDNVAYGGLEPDGNTLYTCSWSDEWNILPYQDVGVGYLGPDGHWVSNAFHASAPQIIASESGDWFWTSGFIPGVLDISIYAAAGDAVPVWSGQAVADDSGFVSVGSDVHGMDLMEGNIVTVSDGASPKELVLLPTTITVFDTVNEVMAGNAPPGSEVWAAAGPMEWQQRIFVDADPLSGEWLADFAGIGFDITDDMRPWSYSHVYDGDGDANEGSTPPYLTTLLITGTDDVLLDDGVCTLREAIIAANTNTASGDMEGECPAGTESQTDTILLASGQTYSLTIDSTCGDDQVCGDLDIWDNSAATDLVMIVDGNGSVTISQDATVDDRVLENHGAGVEIEGLTLTGGTAGWSGGGIFNTGTMLVSHSTITANSSPIDGGGGIANEGSMTLIGSTVSNNTSIHDGGGIANTGSLTLDAGELFGNSGAGGGALANLPGGHATIQNGTQVHNNSAGTGALFNYGTLNVIDSAVFNNIAEYGGGLSNWGGMLTVSNSSVSENSATASAGGIHNKDGGTTFIENGSIISGNTAAWDGGGINNWDGTVTITGSTVSGNSAVQSGGGILNLVAGTVSIDGSILANNTANSTEYSSGGALANWGGTITIANSSVAGNASNWGGGLATHGGTLTLDASTLSGNIATTEGGGIFTNDLGSVLIQNGSLVTANTAGWGGGVSSWDSTLTVDASTVSGNTAQSFGGGILNKEGGGTTVQNGSVISANMAMGGGGVHNEWGSLTIKDSTISENTVTGYGGGIQNSWYGVLTIDDSLIARNMASMGAGIYNLPRTSTSITGSVLSENSASNSGGGIVVESSGYLTMTGSALLSNTSPGDGDAIRMNVYIPNEVKVNASCIVGNGDVAVDNSALYDFQDFSGNWWGDASGPNGAGPGTGDSVSDLVDFSGWLNEPLAICAPE